MPPIEPRPLIAVVDGQRVGIPLGDHPSTHLLKPTPLNNDGTERHQGLAQIEHLCLSLAGQLYEENGDRTKGIGFVVPPTDLWNVGGRSVLVVTRYDRTSTSGELTRIHQEDGCQVLGLDPSHKYQRGPDDLPSLAAFAEALQSWGADPVLDQRALLQHLAFTVCMGNADLHAKNLSILHRDGIRLAPMYDVVTTTVFDVDQELGLRIGGEHHIDDVTLSHLVDEARAWGLGERAARDAIAVVVDGIRSKIDEVAATVDLPTESHAPFERAVAQIKERANRIGRP